MSSSTLNRIFITLAALMLSAAGAFAYTIKGTVTDASGEPLSDATVRILSARDSSFVKGAPADVNGKFSFSGINRGKYIVEATYIGYNKAFSNVSIDKSEPAAITIRLSDSSIQLKETTVVAVKTPIKVMEDTVEYNADSYKTQPNAVVEDLLKRLPGVEVGSDGKITANGKQVSKILVDGKEFFSDDPQVASKNLPVNMVDKLQVVDRKSDLARITGVEDGEEETVINLTVKRGMNNGWFGNVEAGYGTDDRYLGSFNVNRFWNGNQLTFLGNANNINQLGFTDGNGMRFNRFGGDRGITESQSFGINFNVGNEEILRVGGNVMYSHTNRDTRTRQNRQYIFPDSASYSNSSSLASDKGHNIRADFRVEWKPDSFNTLDFRPNMSVNINDSYSNAADSLSALLRNGTLDPVNRTHNIGLSRGKSFEMGGRLIYSHNFKSHRGRSFSISANYSLSNVRERDRAYSFNKFFNNTLEDDLDLYDHFTNNHTWNNNVNARVTWTEPLGNVANGRFLTIGYNFRFRWNNADKLVYDIPTLDEDIYPGLSSPSAFLPADYLSMRVDSLSNRFRNDYFSQDIRIGFKQVRKSYTVDVGFSFLPQRSKSINLINSAKNIPTRHVLNLSPYARMNFKFSKTRSLNFFYNGRSSQPSMNQLQPVADYSNPMNVIQGNPSLDPTFSHNINLRFQDFNMESQRSIMLMANASVTQNAIISHTSFSPVTGGRYTTYENVNGVWNAMVMNMVSLPFGKTKLWSFNNWLFANYRQDIGYNNDIRNTSRQVSVNIRPGVAFRPSALELEVRPFYSIQKTFNTVKTNTPAAIQSYGASFDGTWYAPFGFVLSTDLNFSDAKGYAAGYNPREWMWNAQLSYQFLPGRNASISIKVYDILQQKSNLSRNVSASYIDDTQYNSLTRYCMITFTYKFNTFGSGKQPQDRNFRGFGPGGPGHGPGGPGGPGGGGPGRRH